MKKWLMVTLALAVTAMVLLAACGGTTSSSSASMAPSSMAVSSAAASVASEATSMAASGSTSADAVASATIELSLEELAKYNGKDGQPAFIAVDGLIYDVSNVPEWANGEHNGYEAGTDLTEAIQNSPHGTAVLDNVPMVGRIVEK